jgi:hypothetical protein
VKPTVQVERAPPVCGEPLNVTFVGAVAVAIVAVAFTCVVSLDVLTFSVVEPVVEGFVTPAIVSETAVLFPAAHVPPLDASVTVTVWDEVEPVAEQLLNPLVRVIAGVAGIVKPEAKTTVIVLPAASAPDELVLKFTVQFESAPAVCGEPLTETWETEGSIV